MSKHKAIQRQEFDNTAGQSDNEDNPNWKDKFYDFTQNTTLHGLRYVAMREIGNLRRFLWVLLVCASFAIMGYQIGDRVIYYSKSPINVNIKNNLNDSLKFPFVTICNQNSFRISAADKNNWYDLIEQLFNKDISTGEINWDELNLRKVKFSEMFLKAGHLKEDMIYSCFYNRQKCDAKDFEVKLTYYGRCYTFKPKKKSIVSDNGEVLATKTGSDNGLKLIINIEQYEFMNGPSLASGIQILAHHDTSVPRVMELGLSVPVNSYALIGLDLTVIRNLPKPLGQCGNKELLYSREYFKDDCIFECVTKRVESLCGCRSYLVPNTTDDLEECTVKKYFQCYKKQFEKISTKSTKYCDCPTACVYSVYNPVMSYSSTKENAVNTVRENPLGYGTLIIPSQRKFKRKLKQAMEIHHRKDAIKLQKFNQLRNDLRQARIDLKHTLDKDLQSMINKWIVEFKSWIEFDKNIIEKRKKLFKYQIYNIEKNFITARDIMEEKTFTSICQGYLGLTEAVKYTIDALTRGKESDSETNVVFYSTKRDINIKSAIIERALNDYKSLYNAYLKGLPLYNETFKLYDIEDNLQIVPKALFKKSLTDYKDKVKKSGLFEFKESIKDISRSLNDYVVLLDKAHQGRKFNRTEIEDKTSRFVSGCTAILKSKRSFYKNCIDRPLEILKEESAKFGTAAADYIFSLETIIDNLKSIKTTFQDVQHQEMRSIQEFLQICRDYVQLGNITKLELHGLAVVEKDSIAKIVSFMGGLKISGHNIHENVMKLKDTSETIWKMVLEDENMIPYYEYKNESHFLLDFTQFYTNGRRAMIIDSISTWSPDKWNDYNATDLDEKFVELYNDLLSFKKETIIDENFDRENYLSVDIFYRDLSYVEITQYEGYDIFALLCDIGGSMGLFIGASAITLFELLDVLLNISINKVRRTKIPTGENT